VLSVPNYCKEYEETAFLFLVDTYSSGIAVESSTGGFSQAGTQKGESPQRRLQQRQKIAGRRKGDASQMPPLAAPSGFARGLLALFCALVELLCTNRDDGDSINSIRTECGEL
jgi:hypothetical protein